MSKEFIEAQYGKNLIGKAVRQERQLSYFTRSSMQEDYLTSEYLEAWAERKYQSNDYFLNYVKSIFKTKNFLAFFKFLRKPLPSAKLINNKVVPQLRRVFNAENSEFKYVVDGHDDTDFAKMLNVPDFEQEIFGRMLFNHNSLVVSDIIDSSPYRYFVDIKNVKSIQKTMNGQVKSIAFTGEIEIDGVIEEGYVYIDEVKYSFFNKDFVEIKSTDHNLGHCPVHFISPKVVGEDWILRESIFTYIREELEEYTFLKTLQKMTEPNGAIPIVTKLDVDIIEDSKDIDSNTEPIADDIMSSQRAKLHSNNPPSGDSVLQAGTVFDVPLVEKDGGGIDMEAVKNFINFHYVPVESLNYIKNRISEIEYSIVNTLVGGTIDGVKEGSKNEVQVQESLTVLQNTLIYFADSFNYIRKFSDKDMLMLKYGNLVQEVSIFYGSDFFLDTESMLYSNLEKAENPIERKNILLRINQNRYKGNQNKLSRQNILYDLIPFVSDKDFETAINANRVDEITFDYQTRFNYWIGKFEAIYGDIVTFYTLMTEDNSEKLLLINNLIKGIIISERNDTYNDQDEEDLQLRK